MNLDVGRFRLYSGHKTLQERWEQTRLSWSDAVRQEFAEDFFDPIEPAVSATLAAIDRLSQVLVRMKSDCE